MNGALALALIVIIPFVLFIFWARSVTGQATLKTALGDPKVAKRQAVSRRRATKSTKRATAPKRPTH